MKEIIANTMDQLLIKQPYNKISINKICDAVPMSRRTFYNYFSNKEHLVEWMVEKDFMEHAFPMFSYHLGEKGCQSFFGYIKNKAFFYQRILEYDDGSFLSKCLEKTYDRSAELSAVFSKPGFKHQKKINPVVYRRYVSHGIAAVVVYWIEDGMIIPLEDIARDLYLMLEEPLGYVRDHYLV